MSAGLSIIVFCLMFSMVLQRTNMICVIDISMTFCYENIFDNQISHRNTTNFVEYGIINTCIISSIALF